MFDRLPAEINDEILARVSTSDLFRLAGPQN